MPLYILGLLLLICLLIYTIIKYNQEFKNNGEKLANKFADKLADIYEFVMNSINKSSTTFTAEESDDESSENNDNDKEETKTLQFPTDNVELEKKKRDIH